MQHRNSRLTRPAPCRWRRIICSHAPLSFTPSSIFHRSRDGDMNLSPLSGIFIRAATQQGRSTHLPGEQTNKRQKGNTNAADFWRNSSGCPRGKKRQLSRRGLQTGRAETMNLAPFPAFASKRESQRLSNLLRNLLLALLVCFDFTSVLTVFQDGLGFWAKLLSSLYSFWTDSIRARDADFFPQREIATGNNIPTSSALSPSPAKQLPNSCVYLRAALGGELLMGSKADVLFTCVLRNLPSTHL